MGSYIPSTPQQRQEMLKAIGLSSFRELYGDVPAEMYLDRPLNIPSGMSELEVGRAVRAMADRNRVYDVILRGAGAYDHYIPSIVKYIPAKEEFLTAYTPYQAEMSQGLLQSIFEYQTMICMLTGMDVSNASVYDGATAAAEAAAMCRERKRRVTLISGAAHPDTINTVRTYCYGTGDEMRIVPEKDGRTDLDALREMLTTDVASFYVQQPNFHGLFEDAETLGAAVHKAGALYVMGCNPMALAIMKTPRDCGADIAVGSLIKNPGGGIAPTGGYIVGRKDLVELCAYRLNAPGLGKELGCTLETPRDMYLGFYYAPGVVCEAIKTAIYAQCMLELLGKKPIPRYCEDHNDIVTCFDAGTAEALIGFCQGIQAASPVDSYAAPEPSPEPGYTDEVVMASGSFTQGSTIELSCDGPLRAPYTCYLQGGLNFAASRAGVLLAVQKAYFKE